MSIWDSLDKFASKSTKDSAEKKEINDMLVKFERAKLAKDPIKEEHKEYYKAWRGDQWKKGGARWTTKATINLIFQVCESLIPLLSDRQPETQIFPTQPDDSEIAKQTQDVIQHRWNNDDMKRKLQKTLRDMVIFGMGIMRMRWDSNLSYGMGDYTAEPIDIFDFFPDDAATSTDNMEWFFIRYKMSRDSIKRIYKKDVFASKDEADDHYRESNTYMEKGQESNQVNVYEYWYLNGDGVACMTKFAGKTKLEHWKSPYNRKGFPFVFFHNHISNGELFSYGDVKQLLPIQKQYNKINSIIIDNMIANNNAIWLIDNTSGISKGKIRNEPGLIIEKNQGSTATRVSPPPLPSYFNEQLAITKQMMQDVSGVQDITQKMNNATGPGMQIVAEYTQTRVRSKLQNFEYAIQELGYWSVEMIREHYTQPRIIRLTEANQINKQEFMTYDASGLKPQIPQIDEQTGQQMVDEETGAVMMTEGAVYFDIVVSSGSSMMLNKSAKYQQALELFGAGAMDIETLLAKAEIGTSPKTIIDNLIKYGVVKDPDAKQVDMTSILNELGVRFSLSTNEPELVAQAIQRFRVAEERANQLREMKKNGASAEEMERVASEPLQQETAPQGMPQEGMEGMPPDMMGGMPQEGMVDPSMMQGGMSPDMMGGITPEMLQSLLDNQSPAPAGQEQMDPELLQMIINNGGIPPQE